MGDSEPFDLAGLVFAYAVIAIVGAVALALGIGIVGVLLAVAVVAIVVYVLFLLLKKLVLWPPVNRFLGKVGFAALCVVLLPFSLPYAIVQTIRESRAKARKEKEEAPLRIQKMLEQKRAEYLEGKDLARDLNAQKRLLEARYLQMQRAKENLLAQGEEIGRLERDGDPANLLAASRREAQEAEKMVRTLTIEAARTWGRVVIQERTNRFTVLIRRAPDLSDMKDLSFSDAPEMARERYATLERELTRLVGWMRQELEDQSVLALRPKSAEEIYPLVERQVREANEEACRRLAEGVAKVIILIDRLRFLGNMADQTALSRAANLPDAYEYSPFKVAEAMEQAFVELGKAVDWTNDHLAQVEVEEMTRDTSERLLLTENFQVPPELNQRLIELAVKRRLPQ